MIAWAILRNSLPLQLAGLAVAAWMVLLGNNAVQRHVGASSAVATINNQSQELANDALKAREPADTPGAVGRVRSKYCSDCASVRPN